MGKKGAKKQKVEVPVKTKKAAPVKPPSDSEEDSSSEEEEVQVKAQQKKAVKVQPAKAAESSSEEESSEEETKAPQVTQKKGAAKKAADDDESSSEDDSDEEEQAKPAKKAAAVPQVTQKKGAVKRPAATNNGDDSSSEEDSDEDEEPPAKKAAPAAKKATQKKPAPTEDSDDDEDDSSEDDEEEAAPAKKAPAAKAVNGKKAAKEEESSDEDDSEDDDDEEEEEETVKVAETNKRKKEKGKQEPPVKKPKLDASVTNGEAEAVTLFVGNLDKSTTEDELSEFFTENGITVAEVRKPPNKSNAFVDLGDGDELETALALSGSTFKENTITVEKAKPRGQKEPRKEQQNRSFGSQGGGDDDRDSRTLFVKNLPEDATEDNLGEIFDTAASIRIPQKFGAHKGFGFIEFSDADTMEAAMSEKQGADLNGNSLYLDYLGARSNFKKQRGGPGGRGGDRRGRGNFGGGGGDRRQSNSGMRGESKVLFVSNLSYDTDESSLKSVFGGAVSARIPTFPDSGKPRGIAFVDFKSADAAAEAFDSMNGQSIDGRQVRLDFAAERGSGGGGGGGGFNSRGGGGFSPRGRGGRGGGRGRGGDRGRGRGGGRGGFNKARGGIVQSEGKKTTFDDSD